LPASSQFGQERSLAIVGYGVGYVANEWPLEPRFADVPPARIVPALADEGIYLASESSFARVLRAHGQIVHRGRAKAPRAMRPPTTHIVSATNQAGRERQLRSLAFVVQRPTRFSNRPLQRIMCLMSNTRLGIFQG
jgi:hypothetical protein